MATNLHLDDALIERAVELGGHDSKRSAVNRALEEYVNHLEQERILPLFGEVEYEKDYDPAAQRKRT